jgi:hypothetical protein
MPLRGVKSWYFSKTVWAGIVVVLVTAWNAASEQFGLPPIPEFVFAILGALGVWGRVAATESVRTP